MKAKQSKQIRILGKILFVAYMGFILYFLWFSDWYGRAESTLGYRYNLELFKEIKRFWNNRDILGDYVVYTNLLGNVLIFVPFGFFLPMASKFRSFFNAFSHSFLLSLCVELVQLMTQIGSFDVDDLFLNTVGGCIGYIIFAICNQIRRGYASNKKKK